ncbi:MAG: hypothetical protein Q4G46_03635 [Propionibacteriaceae bacterium]|nr:hypothetical protein [Propionibacteriaceae bacterium]
MTTIRARAWELFDDIVESAPSRELSSWRAYEQQIFTVDPDYDTLRQLLAVPARLGATSQSGVPALALDVWIASELRRAGFNPDQVWPRPSPPRVLSQDITGFISSLPARLRKEANDHLASRGGSGRASANILGKHYVKQVDVVMSSWATGPELMISTKRMDSSFGKNAANRIEESYGDAKNLRSRHPQAALGFLYCLGASALDDEPETARWLIDLLGKLGREADAYDAVGLVIQETSSTLPDPTSEIDPAGPLEPGAVPDLTADSPDVTVHHHPRVTLHRGAVPGELDPGRFLSSMCNLVLDRTPINFHPEARARRRSAQ